MDNVINEIRDKLKAGIDNRTLESSQNFFKEKILLYGVKAENIKRISKEYFRLISNKSKAEILDLCELLWQSGYIEESFIACNWSYFIHTNYEPDDFIVFERWVSKYVNNWASCDTLCNHTIGEFIEMYPEYLSRLKMFAKSDNRWMRRAAAVTLIIPARKGKFLKDILEIADILLSDKDDLVQKGYGWMLKTASQAHLQEVYNYVLRNKKLMPRTALRYAIEKMPKEMKTVAMER